MPPSRTTNLTLTDIPVEAVGAVLNAVRSCGFDLEVRLQPIHQRHAGEALLVIDSKGGTEDEPGP